MAIIKKNPALPDYFAESEASLSGATSLVEDYEAGKVITLPNLRLGIDHAFWAGLPTDHDPAAKKLRIEGREPRVTGPASPELRAEMERHARHIYEQVLPVYDALFAPYRFIRESGVLRLNQLVGLSMHIDSYAEEIPTHHARMFINLDDRPRIWQTSFTADQIAARAGLSPEESAALSPAEWWTTVRRRGLNEGAPNECWDDNPRHVCVFEPGDVWVVDSRQMAHQIFYGRRAMTIDFTVDPASMLDPSRHYLGMVDRLRRGDVGERHKHRERVAHVGPV